MLVLEFALDAVGSHIHHALRRTYERTGIDQPCELIDGKKHFFHLMSRLHIADKTIAMAADSVRKVLSSVDLCQKRRRFLTMLIRILLVVNIV